MVNSNSKFKRLNIAEKALVLNFVPDPRVRGEGVSVRAPCTDPEYFSLGNISRCAFFLIAPEIGLRILFLLVAQDVKTTEGPFRWTLCT